MTELHDWPITSSPRIDLAHTNHYVLTTGVTLKGICVFPDPLTVGAVIPVKPQTTSCSVNEKLKDSRRRDRTTSADK